MRAIYYFVAEHNIKGAKNEIKKCKHMSKDPAWKFSYAFLFAYEGDLDKAILWYDKAFKDTKYKEVMEEVVSFIQWNLDDEPDKIQLLFCMGYLSYKGLFDKSRAIEYFSKFCNHVKSNAFPEYQNKANEFVEQITSKNGLSESPVRPLK